jgi:hypothetical protein
LNANLGQPFAQLLAQCVYAGNHPNHAQQHRRGFVHLEKAQMKRQQLPEPAGANDT